MPSLGLCRDGWPRRSRAGSLERAADHEPGPRRSWWHRDARELRCVAFMRCREWLLKLAAADRPPRRLLGRRDVVGAPPAAARPSRKASSTKGLVAVQVGPTDVPTRSESPRYSRSWFSRVGDHVGVVRARDRASPAPARSCCRVRRSRRPRATCSKSTVARRAGTELPAFDEGRESGHVVGLDVRLEYGPDRRAESPCLLEVLVHEPGVRVDDDSELMVRQAAEQVARAGRGCEEKRPQDHACLTVGRFLVLDKANLPISLIALADTSLSLLWDSTRLRLLVEIDRQERCPPRHERSVSGS